MKDLLLYILNSLVDNPSDITIEETTDESGLVTLTATVATTDMGKVIGKEGRVINAIRQVVRIRAIKEGKRVNVVLTDGNPSPEKARSETKTSSSLSNLGVEDLSEVEGPPEPAKSEK